MTRYRASVHLLCWVTLMTGLSVSAQSPNYHLDFSDGPMRPTEHATRLVSIVNDSEIAIEAVAFLERHQSGEFCVALRPDALLIPAQKFSIRPLANRKKSGTRGLQRGEKWSFGYLSWDVAGGKECEPKVLAVIFADGSYEGYETVVRQLKAQRDGGEAALNFWLKELQEKKRNGSNLAGLIDDGKDQLERDRLEQIYHGSGDDETDVLLYWYWAGRWRVDHDLKSVLPPEPVNDAAQDFHSIEVFVDAWITENTGDVSMRNLDIKYPPISDPHEPSDHSSEKR